MKKLFLFFSLICVMQIASSFLSVDFASAETEKYTRILTENTVLYLDGACTQPLFIIPYTYYCKIDMTGEYSVKVTYGAENTNYPQIKGYIKNTDLNLVETIPTSPFLNFSVSCAQSDLLFYDINLSRPYFNVPQGAVLQYYGDAINSEGKKFCYVYYDSKIGYIDKTCINSFTTSLNPDPLPKEPEPEEPSQPKTEPSNVLGENLQIIIVVGISVICISLVYFLFKPSKHAEISDKRSFTEFEDDE